MSASQCECQARSAYECLCGAWHGIDMDEPEECKHGTAYIDGVNECRTCERDHLRSTCDRLEVERDAARKDADQALTFLRQEEAWSNGLTAERDTLRARVEGLERERDIANEHLCSVLSDDLVPKSALSTMQAQRDEARARVSELTAQLDAEDDAWHDAEKRRIKAEKERDKARAECERMRAVYEAANEWHRQDRAMEHGNDPASGERFRLAWDALNAAVDAALTAEGKGGWAVSGESICGWPEPVCCDDCGKSLSGKEVEHGLEGFGHQHRCCDCYEHRMRNGAPRNPTTEPKP